MILTKIISFVCFFQACPAWSNWFNWAECSTTCGRGLRNRFRICENASGDLTCPGDAIEEEECTVGVSA